VTLRGRLVGLLCLSSCGRPIPGATPPDNAETSTQAPAPGILASVSRTAPSEWRGSYKSAAGTIYIPPDWKVRWSGGDASTGIGDGTMTITIDPSTRRMAGALDGALGPATLDGIDVDGRITANISRKNPTDRGFSGTLVGSIDADRASGTMSVSSGEASTVRTATFALSPAAL
jgi:hypothetical protein